MANVSYDEAGDVLYVNYMPGVAADRGIADSDGVVRRYKDGKLVGVTIVDFTDRLAALVREKEDTRA